MAGMVKFIIFILIAAQFSAGWGCTRQDKITPSEKVFIFARSSDAVGLDPANLSDSESIYVTHQVMESLTDYSIYSTEVKPGLAVKWENSKDGLVWTFFLRRGVKFHDGTDFDAEAVKYNFDRWRLTDHPMHQGMFEFYRSMFDGFPGVIRDVLVVDKYTVKFYLTRPLAPFLANLAMPSFAISSPAAIKSYNRELSKHPVGTGPFKFEKWDPDKEIVLVRNDDYWGEKPKVAGVVFKVIPDNTERLEALRQGEVHAAININPADVPSVQKDPNLKIILRPSMDIGYLAANTEKAPYNDVKVRQALNYAINKQALIRNFYGGLAKPAKNPLPPSIWGYNDEIQDYSYDPAKAKALLAEAGYPKGFTTRLWTAPVARPYLPQPWKIAEAVKADLAKVGIKAEIVTYPWGEYINRVQKGEHELNLVGWIGDNGDPDNFLYVLLDKSNAFRGAATNLAFYKNDKVHDYLTKAREETNQEFRAQLYKKAQTLIKEDAPWVPLVHTTSPAAVSAKVKNWVPHATGTETFNKVDID